MTFQAEFTDRMKWVIRKASELAEKYDHPCIGCEHVALAILMVNSDSGTILSTALKDRNIDLESLKEELEAALKPIQK